MAALTIRNLDERIKLKIKARAALNERSMSAEACAILTAAMNAESERFMLTEGLGTAVHNLFAPLGGVELQIPPRTKSHRPIPRFD